MNTSINKQTCNTAQLNIQIQKFRMDILQILFDLKDSKINNDVELTMLKIKYHDFASDYPIIFDFLVSTDDKSCILETLEELYLTKPIL